MWSIGFLRSIFIYYVPSFIFPFRLTNHPPNPEATLQESTSVCVDVQQGVSFRKQSSVINSSDSTKFQQLEGK